MTAQTALDSVAPSTISAILSRARAQFTVHQNTSHLFSFFTTNEPVFSRFALLETSPVRDGILRVAAHRKASPRHHHRTALYRSPVNPYRHIGLFIPLDLPAPFHKIITMQRTTETKKPESMQQIEPHNNNKYSMSYFPSGCHCWLAQQCANNQPNSENQGKPECNSSRAERAGGSSCHV